MNSISSYLPKLNNSLELISGAHFQHAFSMEISFYNILSVDKFQYQTLISHNIKQSVFQGPV